MRIACLHIPQFALQCATRLDPSLRGAPVVVVAGGGGAEPGRERAGVLHVPVVTACSRAAWAVGVRLGMTATAARVLSPEVKVVTADPRDERETVRAIADAVLGVHAAPGTHSTASTTGVVDVGGRVGAGGAHLAMYAEVPAKMRGSTFGERLLDVIDVLGLTGRIGIADDRFTAWVAAAHGAIVPGAHGGPAAHGPAAHGDDRGVITVPRGGSAAFLSPRPLSLLAISPEVQHMLEALGVRTLGEFAALPAPSVATSRHRIAEADYQALARGESGAALRAYLPEAPIREEVVVGAELADLLPAGGRDDRRGGVDERAGGMSAPVGVALLAHRIALRLAGRGRTAARLEVAAISTTADGGAREVPVTIEHPVGDAEALARVLAQALDAATAELPKLALTSWHLRAVVTGEALANSAPLDTAHGTSVGAAQPAGVAQGQAAGHGGPGDRPGDRPAAPASQFALRIAEAASDRTGEQASDRASDLAAERAASRRAAEPAEPAEGAADDSLSVVLATPGSLFALAPPSLREERRDAHRRTRRGKQRRGRATPSGQSRLFDRNSS